MSAFGCKTDIIEGRSMCAPRLNEARVFFGAQHSAADDDAQCGPGNIVSDEAQSNVPDGRSIGIASDAMSQGCDQVLGRMVSGW
jgi:hypothetical protein